MPPPSFFIVGAAKCGTTALYRYLRAHPAVFMPPLKEPHHFDTDLCVLDAVRDRADYLALFAPARDGQLAGEATASYLYSREAPRLIKAFSPDARILILLRNPVEAIHALHQHHLGIGQETIRDLAAALDAEPERRQGRRIPRSCRNHATCFYRDRSRYAAQVKRYLETFGPARVRVMLQEDLRYRTAATYRDTLRFLGLEDCVRPRFDVVNPRHRVRHLMLHRLALGVARQPWYPRVRRILPPVVRRLYVAANLTGGPAPFDPALRARLQEEFGPEIDRIARIIGRDLSPWHRGDDVVDCLPCHRSSAKPA